MVIKTDTTSEVSLAFRDDDNTFSMWSAKDNKLSVLNRVKSTYPNPRYQGADSIAFKPSLTAPPGKPFDGDRGAMKVESSKKENSFKILFFGGTIVFIILYLKYNSSQ